MGGNMSSQDHARPADRILTNVYALLSAKRDDTTGDVIIDSETASKLIGCYEEMGWSLRSRNKDQRHYQNATIGGQNALTTGAKSELVDGNKRRRKALQVDLLDPAPSEATADFIKAFELKLKNDGIIANKMEKISESGTIVFLICNMSSRLETDIDRVLKTVSQEDYGCLVLIALHVKDKRALPEVRTKDNLSFQERYHGLRGVVDIAFTRENGLYHCSMNETANTEMRRLFEGTA